MKEAYKILIGEPEVRYHLCDIDIDGRIILKHILHDVDWIHLAPDRVSDELL
jgi:hypothetical protein